MTTLRIYGTDDQTVDIETINWADFADAIDAAWNAANEDGDGFAPSDDEDAAIDSFVGGPDALGTPLANFGGRLALYLDSAGNLLAVADANGPWAQSVGSLR